MKKRVFQSANAVMRYFWQEESLPLIPDDHPVYRQMAASSSHSVIQVGICNAAATINPLSSDSELNPFRRGLPVTDFIPCHTFNQHLKWLLQSDQQGRPSIDEINLNFMALRLRLAAMMTEVGPSDEQKCLRKLGTLPALVRNYGTILRHLSIGI
jgi:hypothetical protein